MDGTAPTADRFNEESKMVEGYQSASPDAQKAILDQIKIREHRLDRLEANKSRFHEKNVLEEKDKLFEKHFTTPSPQPSSPEAQALVHQEISAQAERTVEQREQWQHDRLTKESDANIREIVQMDRRGHFQERGDHDHEQEH
ncbi:hypothetical protein [Falsiruegeria litorea]|uniref:hypothetical protein n=1 Tax=Falsiruegeria litorea TaxID=1280831 RepID=UPI001BFE4A34|nr:hypothetical protein [Falsiruegeria litorea]MBT8167606.1 hypothetical protein [Falsiruegeria litorea]